MRLLAKACLRTDGAMSVRSRKQTANLGIVSNGSPSNDAKDVVGIAKKHAARMRIAAGTRSRIGASGGIGHPVTCNERQSVRWIVRMESVLDVAAACLAACGSHVARLDTLVSPGGALIADRYQLV